MCVCVCVCVCVYSVTTKSAFIPASYVHEACISPVNEPRVCYHARTHVIKRYGGTHVIKRYLRKQTCMRVKT